MAPPGPVRHATSAMSTRRLLEMPAVARVLELWRYPVKSMLGEPLAHLEIEADGVVGDRAFAVYDPEADAFASAKTVRRFGQLFLHQASLGDDGAAQITFADGTVVRSDADEVDEVLTEVLGCPARLVHQAEAHARWYTFHSVTDRAEREKPAYGRFVDSSPIHILSTATLASLGNGTAEDARRFRPNVIVDAGEGDDYPEDAWVGQVVTIGNASFEILERCERCVMPSLAQRELPPDPDVRRRLLARTGDHAGVLARVREPGRISRGDAVSVR
jgi:uncharacterized protein